VNDVLVIAECRQGAGADITFELLAAGSAMATPDDGLHVAVVGDSDDDAADALRRDGVDRVTFARFEDGMGAEVYADVVADLFDEVQPRVLLMPHTVRGLDYAPAVASQLSLPILTNVVDVESGSPPRLVRKAYGSKVDASIEVDAEPFAVTVREGEFDPASGTGDPTVVEHDVDVVDGHRRTRVVEIREASGDDVDITSAEFILSIGRGIEEEDNLDLVRETCEALGATLAGSRPLVELGWLPKERQVGQSGQVVTPTVYVAAGISGAIEHLAGMKGSEVIVAINTDESAPIFDVADYGVVGDLFDVLPAIVEAVD